MADEMDQNQFEGQDLDALYQATIDEQRAHLVQLQDDFNKISAEAKEKAQGKLKAVPKEDKKAQEDVLLEQKATLEVALKDLKSKVDNSTRQIMKKLEVINTEREKRVLSDLERQIESL